MKKRMWILMLAALCLLSGCQKQQGGQGRNVPTVQIARSIYYYEQGYMQAEGWKYDVTLASSAQIAQLNKLVDALVMNVQPDEFRLGQGYHLIWRDASGQVEKEMLLLSEDVMSMQGMLFEVEDAAPLLEWLDALRLDEQSVGN